MLAIINGKVILPDAQAGGHFQAVPGRVVLIDGKYIKSIVSQQESPSVDGEYEIFDAEGRYVSPGFINIHIHGCLGADTMDKDPEAIPTMRRGLTKMGVTSLLPTTMTCPLEEIYQALANVRNNMQSEGGAEVLGAHMEGPFISPDKKGAQSAASIRPADFKLLEPYLDVIKYITLAPEELHGDYAFVEQCRRAGIHVSMGHTSADYEAALEAYHHGIRHATHLFNAMAPFQHRKPGVVGAVLDTDCVAELIADGIHAHAAAQRLAWRLKGEGRLILITDSMRACGLSDGESELGGQKVFVKGQLATLADGTIAASVATMDHVVRTFAKSTGIGLARTVELVTRVPAEEMGCAGERGILQPGSLANIAVFDEEANVYATFVHGLLDYQAKNC